MLTQNKKIAIGFVVINACIAFYYIFLSQLLAYIGFNPEEIGILLMIYVLVALVSMPLMGYVADNIMQEKYLIIINLAVSIMTSIVFYLMDKTFFNVAIVISVLSFSFKPIVNVVESYTFKRINQGDRIDYGVVRSMGSFGFAVASYWMGKIIDKYGYNSLFFMQVISAIVTIFIVALLFQKLDVVEKDSTYEIENDKVKNEKINVVKQSTFKQLITNRDYVALIIGGFFINASVSLHFTYMPLLLKENGATAGEIGSVFSLMALVEIPFIAYITKIQKRFRPSILMVFAGFVYIFRMIMLVQVPTVQMFMAMGVLQSVSFSFLIPNYIFVINNIVSREITATAILTGFTIIMNLSTVFSVYFGGYFIGKYGYQEVLQYGWTLCLTGTIIFLLNFIIMKNENRRITI